MSPNFTNTKQFYEGHRIIIILMKKKKNDAFFLKRKPIALQLCKLTRQISDFQFMIIPEILDYDVFKFYLFANNSHEQNLVKHERHSRNSMTSELPKQKGYNHLCLQMVSSQDQGAINISSCGYNRTTIQPPLLIDGKLLGSECNQHQFMWVIFRIVSLDTRYFFSRIYRRSGTKSVQNDIHAIMCTRTDP